MALIALTTRATDNRRLDPVAIPSDERLKTLPAAEAITVGAAVRLDTATGRFTNANATVVAEARLWGIALRTVQAGESVTAYRGGEVGGWDLSALAYDADVFLSNTDGRLDTVAGTVSVVVGRVVPVFASALGTAAGKALLITL